MIPYEFDAERFSRWIAYVLRHNPTRYGLEADPHGFVQLEEFLRVAQRRYPDMSTERLRGFFESTGTARFELTGNRVRARYGHSIPVEPIGPPIEPPAQLYHGTDSHRIASMAGVGLQPVDRRWLHLSETLDEAVIVARHKTDQPAVLQIQALDAHRAGVEFYRESRVFLARQIPTEFVSNIPMPVAEAAGDQPAASA